MKLPAMEVHFNAVVFGMRGQRVVRGKERERAATLVLFIERLDHATPRLVLLWLIAPRRSTWRCTMRPSWQRLLSTMFR